MSASRSRRGTRRGSPLLGLLVILLSLGAGTYLWLQRGEAAQKERIAYLEGLAERLKSETVPIKFMVLSREGGSIQARLKLYDLAGREVAAIEKTWPGKALYVDMLLLPARESARSEQADAWLALPYRIFTDELEASSGTLLFDAYDSGGFPEVLRGIQWSAKEEAAIVQAFASARRAAKAGLPAAGSTRGSFGSAVHEAPGLSRFEAGLVYKVVCRVKGGVEIMED